MLFQKLSGKRANNAPNNSPAAAKTLWSWGRAAGGRLGLNQGPFSHAASPTQVGTLATWSTISAGYVPLGLKNDGTLWGWGGPWGPFGDYIYRSSPTQIGTLATWSKVSGGKQTFAIKADGTLWAWGANPYGALGLGDTISRSSPTQVGTLGTWSAISQGVYNHALALRTDGTLWAWGLNTFGQLGLRNRNNYYSSPTQVGTLATWSAVSTGYGSQMSMALKTDGTLWSWGLQGYGRLGLGDNVLRSSPTQVGTLATWSSISARTGNVILATQTNRPIGRSGHGEETPLVNSALATLSIARRLRKSAPLPRGIWLQALLRPVVLTTLREQR